MEAWRRIARSVPSGISPGWFGTVVYRLVDALNHLVAPRRLPVESKAQRLQLSHDLAVAESRQSPHLSRDYDRVVASLARSWEVRNSLSFPARLDQFPGYVAGNLQRLRNGAPLRD